MAPSRRPTLCGLKRGMWAGAVGPHITMARSWAGDAGVTLGRVSRQDQPPAACQSATAGRAHRTLQAPGVGDYPRSVLDIGSPHAALSDGVLALPVLRCRYTLDRPRLRCIASAPRMAAPTAPATEAAAAADGEGAAAAPAEQQTAAGSGAGAGAGRPEAACKETKLLLLEEGVTMEGGAMTSALWRSVGCGAVMPRRALRAVGRPCLTSYVRLSWGTVEVLVYPRRLRASRPSPHATP